MKALFLMCAASMLGLSLHVQAGTEAMKTVAVVKKGQDVVVNRTLLIGGLFSIAHPALARNPDPADIKSLSEIKKELTHSEYYVRNRAAEQVALLGVKYRDLMIKTLDSQHKEVRIGAIRGLRNIGDESSIQILKNLLDRGGLETEVTITVAEALGDLGAKSAIPLLKKLIKESGNKYIKEYASRSLARIASPRIDRPLIDQNKWGRGMRGIKGAVRFHFLLDDLSKIEVVEEEFQNGKTLEKVKYSFSNSEFRTIFRQLQRSERDKRAVPSSTPGRRLVLTLTDQRQVVLTISDGYFVLIDESHYGHNWHLSLKNDNLAQLIAQKIKASKASSGDEKNR